MYIYIRKMFPNDANGNQISFKKEVAAHFFNAPEEFMRKESNISIHIFHFNNKTAFTDIELQPATDFRFSTRLNSFLSENGEEIKVDDLLYMEKVEKSYGVKLIKEGDSNYDTFNALLDEADRHFLLCTDEEDAVDDDHDTDADAQPSTEYDEFIKLLRIQSNLVLTGAPGTGKTYLAKQIAASMIGNCKWNQLSDEQQKQVKFIQFHPSYDYTDFVEGLRPDKNGSFVRTDGDFKSFCKDAIRGSEIDDKAPYVIIIDEINRGEISKIFGELFYSIETEYRGNETLVRTQYNNMVEKNDLFYNGFYVPKNVFIIGTMNDIDRGVEAMDFAIRRRFAWREITAEESAVNMGISELAVKKMKALNKALYDNNLSEAFFIGGGYFRNVADNDFDSLWKYRLKGIIFEYFRGEPDVNDKMKEIEKAYKTAGDKTHTETTGVVETTTKQES